MGAASQVSLARVLVMVLSVVGCGGDAERASPPLGTDTATSVSAPATDVTPEVQLRVALQQLLQGRPATASEPTWFSAATARALRGVSVDSAGHAVVDFDDLRLLIPNASSSAGSGMLLDELNATVFSVSAIRSVDYLIEGHCERFWEWLQRTCQTVRRPGHSPQAL